MRPVTEGKFILAFVFFRSRYGAKNTTPIMTRMIIFKEDLKMNKMKAYVITNTIVGILSSIFWVTLSRKL